MAAVLSESAGPVRRAQAAPQDFSAADEVVTSLADVWPERWGLSAC